MLEVIDLRKRYRNIVALDGASISVRKSTLTCLVGPNGAGKTTLIECVLGLRKPDSGKIVLLGEEVKGELPSHLAKKIGAVLEGSKLIDDLSVIDNIKLVAALAGVKVTLSDIVHSLELVGARELAKRKYGELSTGQKRKVDIAAALALNPEFVILDEPEAGLDPAARIDLINALRELTRRGLTILFSSHDLTLASQADEVAIIYRGRIHVQGKPTDIALKYGGKWRVKLTLEDGTEQAYELEDLSRLSDIVKSANKIKSLIVEPPSLLDAFKRITGHA